MHDVFLLINFATALALAGDTTHALALFANLLRLEPDRPVQTAVIKRCLLHCWPPPPPDPAAAAADGGGGEAATAAAASATAAAAAAASPLQQRCDVAAVLRFIGAQAGLRAADFVAVLEELGVPRRDLITICQGLLTHAQADPALPAAQLPSVPNTTARGPDRQRSSSLMTPPTTDASSPATPAATPGNPMLGSPLMGSRPPSRDLSSSDSLKGRLAAGTSHLDRHVSRDNYQAGAAAMGVSSGSAGPAVHPRAIFSSGGGPGGTAAALSETVVDLQAACLRLQEAMGVVPKLLALVEADVRAEAAEKFAALEQEVGIAEPEEVGDGGGSDEEASGAAARVDIAVGGPDRRGRGRHGWAVMAVAAGALLPGVLGRAALAAPVIALLLKR